MLVDKKVGGSCVLRATVSISPRFLRIKIVLKYIFCNYVGQLPTFKVLFPVFIAVFYYFDEVCRCVTYSLRYSYLPWKYIYIYTNEHFSYSAIY